MAGTWKRIITTNDDANYKNSNVSTFSGNYNDLSNKPTIPTNNNQLTNGRGFTTNVGDITAVTAGTGLTGGGTSGAVTLNLSIPNDTITSSMIQDEAITDNQMAEDAVSGSIIEDDGVIDGKLASNCVNAGNIKSGAVTYAKLDTSVSGSSGQILMRISSGTGMNWITPTYLTSLNGINNGHWSGTDLSVANGGTGASSASTARGKNNLDVNQSGWLGYNDRIKILPSDFMQDSDNTTANYAMTSAHNGSSGRVMNSSLEAIGAWNIPSGFKATSCKLYASTTIGAQVYECNIASSTASSKGTGNATSMGGTINFTDITASTTNYIAIRLDFTATNHYFYGGYISITRA